MPKLATALAVSHIGLEPQCKTPLNPRTSTYSSVSMSARDSIMLSPLIEMASACTTRRCQTMKQGCEPSSRSSGHTEESSLSSISLPPSGPYPSLSLVQKEYWSPTCPDWPCVALPICMQERPKPTPGMLPSSQRQHAPCLTHYGRCALMTNNSQSSTCCAALMMICPPRPHRSVTGSVVC